MTSKELEKATQEDSEIVKGGSEKEILDRLESLLDETSDHWQAIREHTLAIGQLQARVAQIVTMRQIVVLAEAHKQP